MDDQGHHCAQCRQRTRERGYCPCAAIIHNAGATSYSTHYRPISYAIAPQPHLGNGIVTARKFPESCTYYKWNWILTIQNAAVAGKYTQHLDGNCRGQRNLKDLHDLTEFVVLTQREYLARYAWTDRFIRADVPRAEKKRILTISLTAHYIVLDVSPQ